MTMALLTPVRLGSLDLPNRILMAPLTRARSDRAGVPNDLMAEYYVQRASAGLIISEATGINREGLGMPNAPGIWNADQVAGWARVTDAVHRAGGRIMLQLWHMGRVVHPSVSGMEPVSASATAAPGKVHTYEGKADFAVARAMSRDDIARLLDDYAQAARNARAAGFDGIQLHAANGYLIDQFLRDGTNLRDDDYGGPIANRVRLLDEVVARLLGEWEAGLVSVRLSPNDAVQGVADSDPVALFSAAAQVLDRHGIGFLEMRDPPPAGTFGKGDGPRRLPLMRQHFRGAVVDNCDYSAEEAEAAVASGAADAIAFGRPYISNPDLVERIARGVEWAPNLDGTAYWYVPGPKGYTDYPVLAEAAG
ncbi:MAG: alkene reductase [Proteobacteria bacterium]|nr:alkene reductase [Pseudomonadota bacterium]